MTSTEREKIISLANSCGTTEQNICGEHLFVFYVSDLEAFYKAAQNEAYDQVIEFVRNKNYDNDPYILARKIEEMKELSL